MAFFEGKGGGGGFFGGGDGDGDGGGGDGGRILEAGLTQGKVGRDEIIP